MRTHCKFERGAVTEMAYQLTKTNHLIYSPTPQTSKTFIKMAQLIEFTLTKITKNNSSWWRMLYTIAKTYYWNRWHHYHCPHHPPIHLDIDPFVLPANMLTSPAYFDHRLYDIKKNVLELIKHIDKGQQINVFEEMSLQHSLQIQLH